MNEREKIIRLWFDMWIKKADLGIDNIFTDDVVYTESWSPTTVDVHTKERKANGCGYKTEHVGLGLRGISKEQLEKGDKVIVKNANMYGM